MTRVAPAAALLGAYALKRHTEMIPALRQGGRLATDALRDAGLPVLTDPDRHAPGIVAVRAAPEHVRQVLSGMSFPGALRVTAVDRAELEVHRDYPEETALAVWLAGITVITLGSPAGERRTIAAVHGQSYQ
jgi:hypothetical protein